MHQDFLDLLRAFIDRSVRFMIVGAYALGVHGRPRATGDLDVWVDPTPDNAESIRSPSSMYSRKGVTLPLGGRGSRRNLVFGRQLFTTVHGF